MSIVIIDEIHLNTDYIVGYVFAERDSRYFCRITTSHEVKVGSALIKEVSFYCKNAEEKDIVYHRLKDAFINSNGVYRIIPIDKEVETEVTVGVPKS